MTHTTRSIALALGVTVLAGCGAGTKSATAPSAVVPAGAARHVRSTGSISGHFKLVSLAKPLVGGDCIPGQDTWTTPTSTIAIVESRTAFYAWTTMTLDTADPVTFTNTEAAGANATLVVSSSNTSYTPVGTWNSATQWTPPSAGTYYVGYTQEWMDDPYCTAYTEYDGTFSLSWAQ